MDPEIELLRRWRDGDGKAGDQLLLRYHTIIWRTVATKVPEAEVEDLVQRVILALVERRDRISSDLKFRSYALAVARKMILGHFRERYRKPVDHVGVADTSVKDLGAGASSVVLAREQDRLLLEALRSLSLDDQLVLELYYWEGMTGPELGAVFDCLEPTVRGRLHRAKGRLELELVELSKQHRELAETMTDLDAWAASVREALQPQLQGK
ncbi:MAG: sigma-70 family RNA polymerase sigma factor [Myxococcales bacterium]|nr:sigma-70 family RNA polymerase sigma factor [Myxococcales bacterium]